MSPLSGLRAFAANWVPGLTAFALRFRPYGACLLRHKDAPYEWMSGRSLLGSYFELPPRPRAICWGSPTSAPSSPNGSTQRNVALVKVIYLENRMVSRTRRSLPVLKLIRSVPRFTAADAGRPGPPDRPQRLPPHLRSRRPDSHGAKVQRPIDHLPHRWSWSWVAPVLKLKRKAQISDALKMLGIGIYQRPFAGDRCGGDQGVRHADASPLGERRVDLSP